MMLVVSATGRGEMVMAVAMARVQTPVVFVAGLVAIAMAAAMT